MSSYQFSSVQESVDSMRLFIHLSISSIVYLRHLLEEDCFQDFLYQAENGGDKKIVVKSLLRNKDSKTDQLLDWIDNGIIPLLSKGHLQGFCFFLFNKSIGTSNILESYNFSFRNRGWTKTGFVESSPFYCGHTLLKKLIYSLQCREVNTLADSVDLRLVYNESCPPEYQPSSDFKDVTTQENTRAIYLQDGDPKRCKSLGYFETADNRVSIKTLIHEESELDEELVPVDPLQYIDVPQSTPAFRIDPVSSDTTNLYMEEDQTSAVEQVSSLPLKQEKNPEVEKQMSCECLCSTLISPLDTLNCSKCLKTIHKSCYGKTSDSICCYSCIAKRRKELLHPELPILTNVRKLYTIFAQLGIPDSLSALLNAAGFEVNASQERLDIFKQAFYILGSDKVLYIDMESQITPCDVKQYYNVVNIDVKGILDFEGCTVEKAPFIFVPELVKFHDQFNSELVRSLMEEKKKFYFADTILISCVSDMGRPECVLISSDPIEEESLKTTNDILCSGSSTSDEDETDVIGCSQSA